MTMKSMNRTHAIWLLAIVMTACAFAEAPAGITIAVAAPETIEAMSDAVFTYTLTNGAAAAIAVSEAPNWSSAELNVSYRRGAADSVFYRPSGPIVDGDFKKVELSPGSTYDFAVTLGWDAGTDAWWNQEPGTYQLRFWFKFAYEGSPYNVNTDVSVTVKAAIPLTPKEKVLLGGDALERVIDSQAVDSSTLSALDAFAITHPTHPSSPKINYALGTYFANPVFDKATKQWTPRDTSRALATFLRADPINSDIPGHRTEVLCIIAQMYMAAGTPSVAMPYLDKAVALDGSQNEDTHGWLAEQLRSQIEQREPDFTIPPK